ncbi:MAG: hypothetical protein GX878_07640 [Firmicutes bacterium]|nr:hypothetical protein [Bacillota bacterium]
MPFTLSNIARIGGGHDYDPGCILIAAQMYCHTRCSDGTVSSRRRH